MKNKIKLKKGDEVIVLAGKDKGKRGKINVKDIISYDKIFIEEKSVNKISERLSWKK